MDTFQNSQTQISKIVFCLLVLLLSVTACRGAESMIGMHPDDNQANNPSIDQIELETFPKKDIIYGTHLRFDHLSVEDGLSQSIVICILQDSQGFMWFGTEDGLNQFNGYSFTHYRNNPNDPTSISGNWILSMLEDHRGRLWIGTKEDGLNLYIPNTDQFISFANVPGDSTSLSDNEISAIFQDRNGTIWIGTRNGGLNKFDENESTFYHYQNDPANPNSLSSNAVTAILEDQAGMLWIATRDNGLNKFEPQTDRWWHFSNNPNNPESLNSNRITTIFEDSLGVLWIGMDGGGLDKFDPGTDRFIHYQNDPDDSTSLSGDIVASIFQDRTGVLWIGTRGNGLNQYDPEKNAFNRYQNISGELGSLSNDFIISIFQDREGILWLGTYGDGVNTLQPGWEEFSHYFHSSGRLNNLSGNMVWSFFSDSADALWIGSYGNGVDHFDRKNNLWQNIAYDDNNPNSLSGDIVSFIYQDSAGYIWMGTDNALEKYDPETGSFTHFQAQPGAPPGALGNYKRAIIEKSSGQFWIGTKGGLYEFDSNQNRWDLLYTHLPNDSQSISDDFITSMQVDQNANLWLGTYNGGLNKIELETKTITRYQHDINDPLSLSDDLVMTLFVDSKGSLWVGTPGGLDRFDPETETFFHYREEDGLPNNTVYCILEDNEGNLWFSTNKGISKFYPQTDVFENYDVSNGLQSNEFNVGACHKNDRGEMFFGGINGFNVFMPDDVHKNQVIPPVVITSLTSNKEQIYLPSQNGKNNQITLQWPLDSFEFEYAALSFSQPEKNQYAYYLEGFEDTWKEVGTRRFGEYTNLPGGEYTLRIKGSNNDGVWNEVGVAVQITVVPPFWQTGWFYGVVVVAVLGLFYGGYRLRVRSLEARGRELEFQVEQRTSELMQTQAELKQIEMEKAVSEERNRLARDLHDSVTQSIYSLTLLSEAGQRMIDSGDFVQVKDNQSRLGEISQQALQEMRLLVYELRPQILQNEGLVGALEHRLAAVERRAGINARLHSDQEIDLPQNVEEELFYITMEALNNALKHANASEVVLWLKVEEESLILTVEDNGRGFDSELSKSHGGIGLSSMIERAEKIGGSLSIQSEPGAGTTVTVSVPLAAEHKSASLDPEENLDG